MMTEFTEETVWPWVEADEHKPAIGFMVWGNGREPVIWDGQTWQSALTREPTEITRWRLLNGKPALACAAPVLRDARPAQIKLLNAKCDLYATLLRCPSESWTREDIDLGMLLGRDPEMQEWLYFFGREGASQG